ncbi:piggyBac transposable element-derived protein 4-like [Schistocerca serialis cubense]|uniref:piggyBac transposable element-derived protein 4-like n=1 Tax=Schistocerca serialis cubense TaxID=2023355 RepID=UPI00214F0711|nr:piggyBac transposable element-derived protein 4-like [Schistocerca serialis cubense]
MASDMDKRVLQWLDDDNDDCVDVPDFSRSSKSRDSSASNMSSYFVYQASDQDNNEVSYVGGSTNNVVLSSKVDAMFRPRKAMPNMVIPAVLAKLDRSASELDIFEKIFPPSLFIFISQCTNQRLQMIKKTTIQSTDPGEIRLVLEYWSHNTSMGNVAIKRAISRDRCKVLLSKLYFNFPEKPDTAVKLYYPESIVACLRNTFQKAKSESTAQSIDRSMVKFKGRSALKQYLPMKPVKHGIKIWMRSDSVTGYTYDFNIYCGKDANNLDGTLGEHVVLQLSKTIRDTNVMLSFDRFFTSIHLMDTLPFAAVGTLNRKAKDGSKLVVECLVALKTYNEYMGGVDLADQMSTLYDLDRKSDKWWKKVSYKLLLTIVVNAWILQKEIQHKTVPLKHFLVNLAEQMIAKGQKTAKVQWKYSAGRPSKRARATTRKQEQNLPAKCASIHNAKSALEHIICDYNKSDMLTPIGYWWDNICPTQVNG